MNWLMKFQVPQNVRTNDYWLLQKSCAQWHYANLGDHSSKTDCEMCCQHLPYDTCWLIQCPVKTAQLFLCSWWERQVQSLKHRVYFSLRQWTPCKTLPPTIKWLYLEQADIRQPLFLHVYQHGILLLPLWATLCYQPLVVTVCTTCFTFPEWSFCPHSVFICSTWLA